MPIQALSSSSITESKVNTSNLRELAELVARIYLIFSKISQSDRKETSDLEIKFKIYSIQSADLMRSRGNWALGTALLTFTAFAASLAFTNANDKKFVQLLSEKTPDLLRVFDARREADIRSKDSLAQLEMTKMQDKNNKSQSEGNTKEHFAQILQAEIQRLRSASSPN